MKNNFGGNTNPEGIEQLAHSIVSTWISDCSINLRPLDRYALKKIIAQTIPKYTGSHNGQNSGTGIESVKERERRVCVEAIADLKEEPFPGYISKQRALNACLTAGRPLNMQSKQISGKTSGSELNNISARNTS